MANARLNVCAGVPSAGTPTGASAGNRDTSHAERQSDPMRLHGRLLTSVLCAAGLLALAACGPKTQTISQPYPFPAAEAGNDTLAMEALAYEDLPPVQWENGFEQDTVLNGDYLPVDTAQTLSVDSVFSDAYSRYEKARGLIQLAQFEIDTALALLDTIPEGADSTVIANRDQMYVEFSRLMRQLGMAHNRNGLSANRELPLQMNRFVEAEIRRFQTGRERRWFLMVYERSGRYLPMIQARLREAGMPEQLAWLPFIESGFSNEAHSRAGALGMWQFIRSTGLRYDLRRDRWIDGRKDFELATGAAVTYMTELHDMFGDWNTALAAYNCGEGRVMRTINRQRVRYMDDFWDLYLQLPTETARYVPKLHAVLQIINDPERFGFTDLPQQAQPIAFDTVRAEKEMSLDHIADRMGVPRDELRALNPALVRNITPSYSYVLRVPAGKAADYRGVIDEVPVTRAPDMPEFVRHRVRSGETLGSIARRYRTTVGAIMRANGISNPRLLRAGRVIRVPTRAARYSSSTSSASSTASSASASSTVSSASISPESVHVVRSGETLWSISQRYNISLTQLRQLNGLGRTSRIYPGQRLRVSR